MSRLAPVTSLLERAVARVALGFTRSLLPAGQPTRLRACVHHMVLASLAACLAACALEQPRAEEARALSQSITGGLETQACEWPSVVALGGCSGTLVHPLLVVYAAHCGLAMADVRFGTDSLNPARVVQVSHCHQYPEARLGDGTDVAYCVLREPVLDVQPARILAGCELDELSVGKAAQIVGFGVDTTGGDFGRQRAATTSATRVTADELFLDSSASDTCRGDSGGPVFIEVASRSAEPELRLAGLTSAGTSKACGEGQGHYVNLASKVDWLESSSGLDLTPCFDGPEWRPTPGCSTVAIQTRDESVQCETPEPGLSSTCGQSFALPPDAEPPRLELAGLEDDAYVHRLHPDESYLALELPLRVEDDGWGVQQVAITLLDADGASLFQRVDEVAPYGIEELRVPPGVFELSVTARDHAGNRSARSLRLQVSLASEDAGCTVARLASTQNNAAQSLLALGLSVLVVWARRSSRDSRDARALKPAARWA